MPDVLDVQKIERVVDDLDEQKAEERASYRTAPAKNQRASDNNGGNTIQKQSVSVEPGLNKSHPGGQHDASEAAAESREHEDSDLYAIDVYASQLGVFFAIADGDDIGSDPRVVVDDIGQRKERHQEDERPIKTHELFGSHEAKEIIHQENLTARNDQARKTLRHEQRRQSHDEGRKPQLGDQRTIEEPHGQRADDDHANANRHTAGHAEENAENDSEKDRTHAHGKVDITRDNDEELTKRNQADGNDLPRNRGHIVEAKETRAD